MTADEHSGSLRPDALASTLGIAIERVAIGEACARIRVGDGHLNPHATAHGARIYAVAGVVLGAAANDHRYSGVVRDVHIEYVRAAHLDDELLAHARVVDRLPREDLFDIHVTLERDGSLIARATGRATRRDRTTLSDARGTEED